eukprot:GFUD01006148.1.p1 GENE.GFUD01006148.1~~GFUD01006148.1.p1  ORF type:complete len:499 (+),score=146.27 GFUD01006148.1:42-1538(+)
MPEMNNKILKWRNRKKPQNLVNKKDLCDLVVEDELINLLKKNIEDSNNIFAIIKSCIYNIEAEDSKALNEKKVQQINKDKNSPKPKENIETKNKIQNWLDLVTGHEYSKYLFKSYPGHPVSDKSYMIDPYITINVEEIDEVDGHVSKTGLPVGMAMVALKNGVTCFGNWKDGQREGVGKTSGPGMKCRGVTCISGSYNNGVLEGLGKVETVEGLTLTGRFDRGYLEGIVVGRSFSDNFYVGEYQRGVAVGPCWRRVEGGGWLHGVVDKEGQFTGEDMMYIYPDLVTCLVGNFRNGVMIEARESMVDMIINPGEEGDILHVRAAAPGPGVHIFSYQPSDAQAMSVDYQQQDPYERDRVECRRSAVQNAGEGVFAITDIPQDTFVCFYHGIYIEEGKYSPQENCEYQIFLDWQAAPASPSLDILPDAWSYQDYKASLGHKVNHSWQPNCQYAKFYHPVFGHTALGIRTIRQVARGEELSTNYRYDVDACPEWYYRLYNEQ